MRRVLLMYGLFAPSAGHCEALRRLGFEVAVAQSEAEAIELAREAEVILGHRFLRQSLPGARRLRWVQSTAGGVDRLPCDELYRRNVMLTRVTFTAPHIARHAVTLAWALTRGLPSAFQQQMKGAWLPRQDWLPNPQRAVVFGFGEIGQAIARLVLAEGLAVVAVNRSGQRPPGFASMPVVPLADSDRLLGDTDWCFLALPANPETVGLFDEARLRRLRATAALVNVGRGSTVVTKDLCAILQSGHLGGAALDVVEPEPLPEDHPLWTSPRVLLTPHVAAHYPGRAADMERFAELQAARYLAGEPVLNQVDPSNHA